MRTVYALIVGIDDYSTRDTLKGCVNDARAAETWLRQQRGVRHAILPLHDEHATKAAVLRGIQRHLGRAGAGDTALLWFSGHGSQESTRDPREGTGMCQALVCHDSLQPGGQPLLQDQELGALLDRIAARGTHVVAVLDSCFSGGATREDGGPRARGVAWRPWWHTATGTTGTRDGGGNGPEPRRHVLLAACRPQELANEDLLDGAWRGYFSHALLHALDTLGPTATYGGVHALVEERVRSLSGRVQHPELRGPHDGRFLTGEALPTSPFLLRHTASGWEVDCGYAHGLRAPGAEFTLLDRPGGGRRVVVRDVGPESSRVEPAGWRPGPADREGVHAVTPSALAFPPAAVTVVGERGAVRLLSAAISGEPLLTRDGGNGLPLRVEATADGWARVSGGAGRDLPPLPLRTATDAARVAGCLAHITRWHHIRDLTNPDPYLSALVRITVDKPLVGDLTRTATGDPVLRYTRGGREPQARVRIHNDSDRMLWCVLLDLTDSYGCNATALYEGDFVKPGGTALARRGEPVWFHLPPGRTVVRGASATDWLKLIVTENELNTAPFRLPAWSPDAPPPSRSAAGPASAGLLHLSPPQGTRDAGGPAHGVGRWGTATAVVRTEVP
ncbi:caspase family protein [Streptomyces mashuensis]|nr:caspase family protein [Streptomyces mashuensis]